MVVILMMLWKGYHGYRPFRRVQRGATAFSSWGEARIPPTGVPCGGVRAGVPGGGGLLTPRTGAAGGERPPQDSQEPDF